MARKISYTQYSMFQACPLQWKLSYVDELKSKDSSIELIFGTAIHNTIQNWLFVHFNESKTKANVYDMVGRFKADLMELFRTNFITDPNGDKLPVCDRDTFQEYYVDGVSILDWVKDKKNDVFPASGLQLVGTEIPLNVDLKPGLTFIGFIDLVIRNPKTKEIFIYDLKTSKRGWSFQKKDTKKTDQLLLYKKFYSDVFDVPLENINVEFLILKRKLSDNKYDKRVTSFEPPNKEVSINKMMTRFNSFIDIFDDEGNIKEGTEFNPMPSESNCRFCPFRNKKDLCPKGIDIAY